MITDELAQLRWQLENEALAAQALHDHVMGQPYGAAAITNYDRLSYLTRFIGIDRSRLDAAIEAERAALSTRCAV